MKNRIFTVILAFAILLLAGCSQKGSDGKSPSVTNLREVEPNNKNEEAQPVENGSAVKGYINEPMDQDRYYIHIPEDSSAILRAELSGLPDINIKIEILDQAEDVLLEADRNKEGEGEIITNFGLSSGDYYIRVRELWLRSKEKKSNDSTFYVLKINLSPVTGDVEFEPNNRGVTATPLTAGLAMKGYLSPHNDEDWYKLELPKEGFNYMSISLSDLENVDTQISIYDPIEALILEKDAEAPGTGEFIPNLGIDPSKEFYYIVVKTPENRWHSNEDSQYTLRVDFLGAAGNMEIEPNDRLVRATHLTVNDTTKGFIETSKDEDWYELTNDDSTATTMRIEALGVKKVDLVLSVYNELEEKVLTVNDGGELEPEIMPNLCFQPKQSYYIKISNNIQKGNSDEFYSIIVSAQRYYNDEEFELNNSAETASMLVPNKSTDGYIHPGGDVDFYRLDLRTQEKVQLDLVLQGILKVNTNMTLYDGEMNELATGAARPAEETEKIGLAVEAGIYYVKVSGASDKECNYRDEYKLISKVRPIF